MRRERAFGFYDLVIRLISGSSVQCHVLGRPVGTWNRAHSTSALKRRAILELPHPGRQEAIAEWHYH